MANETELTQLELLCKQLYEATNMEERSRAESSLVAFSNSPNFLAKCQSLLEKGVVVYYYLDALLFETYSVAQISEIEAKLKKEIEKRKDDLRQIIGEKYKDLIDVSDGLQVMAQRSAIVVNEIGNLDNQFHQYKSSVNQAIHNRQKLTESPVNRNNLKQFELSVKCKIIVKSLSQIWYYYDINDILSATFFYSRVCTIWSQLKDTFNVIKPSQPNIVNQYADIILDFGDNLVNQAWNNVLYDPESTSEPDSIATNLNCISILQTIAPSRLLEEFLERRFSQMNSLLLVSSPIDFNEICLNLFGNLFDTCRLAYLVFVEDMGIPNLLARSKENVEKFQASQDFICNQQYMSLVPNEITNFHLKPPFTGRELDKNRVQEMCRSWIHRINQLVIPQFSRLLDQMDSIVDLFTALKETNSLLEESNELLNWTDLNGILFNNEIFIWEFFLRESVLNVMQKLIISAVASSYDTLKASIQVKLLSEAGSVDETPLDVVWKNDSMEQCSLTTKAFALTTGNIEMISLLEQQLQSISDQLTIIQEDSSRSFITSKDLTNLQNVFTSTLVDHLSTFISSCETIVIKNRSDLLKLANVYRTLVYGCPKFKGCHYLFSKGQTEWNRSRSLLKKAYDKQYIDFLTATLTDLMEAFKQDMDVSSISKFLDLCLSWEEITLEEVLEEDGKTIRSNIRIPMQISIPLYTLIKQLNLTINNIGAHTISRSTILSLLGELNLQLNDLYQHLLTTIIQNDTPKNVKHTQILQFYFDLSFLDQLIATIKEDSVRKDLKPAITDSITNYTSQIDPFDLHVLQPHLQSSVQRYLKSVALIFGNLIGPSVHTSSSISHSTSPSVVKTETKQEPANPIPSYSLAFKFPILEKTKNRK